MKHSSNNSNSRSRNFLQLTPEDVIWLNANLHKSEMALLLYIYAQDRFGNQWTLQKASEIAVKLQIGKATYYRALARLEELKLITTRGGHLYVKPVLQPDNSFSWVRQESHPRDKSLTHETRVSPTRLESHPRENCELEPSPGKGLKPLRSIDKEDQEDQEDFKKTRAIENLEEDPEYRAWVQRGIDSLPHPPKGSYGMKVLRRELKSEVNKREFLELRKTREEVSCSAPPPPSVENEEEDRFYRRLGINQVKWKNYPAKRNQVKAWVDSEPRATLGEDGPIELIPAPGVNSDAD